ncbi:MAG: hypothetical protein OEY67_04970 [Gammaproteobacteria bacterium]|nr:hypothetical protein [Gammaproteobacteria bacterium]
MKPIALQLVTVDLENGQQGVFVGVPLVTKETTPDNSQIEEIWFSTIQEVPDDITVAELMQLVQNRIARSHVVH